MAYRIHNFYKQVLADFEAHVKKAPELKTIEIERVVKKARERLSEMASSQLLNNNSAKDERFRSFSVKKVLELDDNDYKVKIDPRISQKVVISYEQSEVSSDSESQVRKIINLSPFYQEQNQSKVKVEQDPIHPKTNSNIYQSRLVKREELNEYYLYDEDQKKRGDDNIQDEAEGEEDGLIFQDKHVIQQQKMEEMKREKGRRFQEELDLDRKARGQMIYLPQVPKKQEFCDLQVPDSDIQSEEVFKKIEAEVGLEVYGSIAKNKRGNQKTMYFDLADVVMKRPHKPETFVKSIRAKFDNSRSKNPKQLV